ncbi:sulfotransferase family 2 domain-containing protein [Bacillus sp. V3B]|uniref:sulfotransferase family 2 domain-containing protein n=1 Tax=Bacillus sp. V3B TaxID=2804915 RepID=UPI00210AA002|nr:sulfotransferase family 2 domain-containing protein [Bacillus sp. V3B]MCQ6274865.1 sulfotransferase family 2 domain-containing protein [Bacillus sp. V3B]
MDKNGKVVLFLHIPKTAGSTLKSILDNQYTSLERMDYYGGDFSKFINAAKNNPNLKCINGHFRFGIHKRIQKPFCYVTMLRHPIERVLSTYYYIKRPNHTKNNMVKNMSIEDFVASKEAWANHMVSNLQTTYVSGSTPPNLEVAKKNLEQYFDVVGITEMFDQSLFLMKKSFGWKNIDYKSENITKNRPTINEHSKEVIDLITQKNQLDLKLYKFGKYLLNQKIVNLDHKTKVEMNKFLGDIKRY